MRLTLLALPLLLATTAAADPVSVGVTAAPERPYSVGFRIGGYGFHRDGDTSANSWNECRMNGIGIFGDRTLRGPLFAEVGLDAYFSQNFPTTPSTGDLAIERTSGLVSVAIGARTAIFSWLHAYAQLGTGLELTRVAVPYGDRDTIRDQKILPEGFFGIGGDIRLGSSTYFGASFRTLVMGNFNYDKTRLEMGSQWTTEPAASEVFAASPSLAAQGQFYVRRDL